MKKWICIFLLILALAVPARAAAVPDDLLRAAPEGTEELMGKESGSAALSGGAAKILDSLRGEAEGVLKARIRGAVGILLVVLLCGAAEGFSRDAGGAELKFVPLCGALSVTALAAGGLDSLIGLGVKTVQELSEFSHVLLPSLAAAAAAAGAVGSATVQQVTTVFFVDLLVQLINGLLVPMVYLYIGALAAAAMLSEGRLWGIAEALKKGTVWVLSGTLVVFTVYLSAVRIISGAADGAAVKMAKAAISGTVPVVGGIISEVSETVLAGAGLLKNTIGVFGMLAVLSACAYPFLQLGVQYLLYKLAAFLAGTVGDARLCRLIDGLGGAFGLVLGMTGSCALLLLISVLSCVAAVVP